MSRAVLLDNTVLSNLALTGRDDLPFRLWGELQQPPPLAAPSIRLAWKPG